MLLGCIADDFTGASDLANTLARGGMATTLFAGMPVTTACEAGVVALKTRSVPAAEAVEQSLRALAWLQGQGAQQILFKYCSTFDSTPNGNIGPVAAALMAALDAPVAVVCPAFPGAGRRVFQGHLFVGARPLHESGMERHPLTPMTDPDLRRWLARQTSVTVGHVPLETVRAGELGAALRSEQQAGRRLVVVDAVADEDLLAIGAAVAGHRLVTGGSGIAMGLPANFRSAGLLRHEITPFNRVRGRGLVLSGSCSATSNAQAANHLAKHPGLSIDAKSVVTGAVTPASIWARVQADGGISIISTTAAPDVVATAQDGWGRDRVATAIENFFGELARLAVAGGVSRLVVGGGETSGAVVAALVAATGVMALRVGPEIAPGVPALAAGSSLNLALKSGNFGGPNFYKEALAVLGDA